MLEGFHDNEWDFAIGTVRGYRWWSIYPPGVSAWEGTVSVSTLVGHAYTSWTEPELKAHCKGQVYKGPLKEEAHRAPDPDCQCGIYAFWNPVCETHLRAPANCWLFSPRPRKLPGYYMLAEDGHAFGVIEGSGHVILGSKGFRCENAKLLAISVLPDNVFTMENVESFDNPMDLIATYPPVIPSYLNDANA